MVRRRTAERSLRQCQRDYGRALREAEQLQQQLRRVSHALLFAQEEERKKISRELHDVVAQTLVEINARLAALKAEESGNASSLEQTISSTQRLVEKSVGIVHRFARELRPAGLDDLGFIRALHGHMKNLREKTGIHFSLTASAAVEGLNTATRTVLYRVAQEALTNVIRHAHASRAKVTVQKIRQQVRLKIADNGRGFSPRRGLTAKRNARLGLIGMRERLEMVGGKLTIDSTPGKGTIIVASVPV